MYTYLEGDDKDETLINMFKEQEKEKFEPHCNKRLCITL